MTECPRCKTILSSDSLEKPSSECPHCGHSLSEPTQAWETGQNLIQDYFSDLFQILTQPTKFFRTMPTQGGLSRPLCFALVTHWLGSAIGFIWSLSLGGVNRWLQSLFHFTRQWDDFDTGGQLSQMRDRFLDWFFGAGAVIVDPFLTLITILFTSALVFIGARILVSPGKNGHPLEITLESSVRIICFGMTPAILSVIPVLGAIIAPLYTLWITAIAAKEVYHVSTLKGFIIALFPKFLFFGIILLGLLLFIMTLLKLMTSMF